MNRKDSTDIAFDAMKPDLECDPHLSLSAFADLNKYRVQRWEDGGDEYPYLPFTVYLRRNHDLDYYYYETDCAHLGKWCPCLDMWFGRRLDRLTMAHMVGGNFALTIPLYPQHEFGICLDFNSEVSDTMRFKDYWTVSADFAVGNSSKTVEFGTADILTSRKELKALIESQFEYMLDVLGKDLNNMCGDCNTMIESLDEMDDRMLVAVTGKCGVCNLKAKALADAVKVSDHTDVPEGSSMPSGNRLAGPVGANVDWRSEVAADRAKEANATAPKPISSAARTATVGPVTMHTEPSSDAEKRIQAALKARGWK